MNIHIHFIACSIHQVSFAGTNIKSICSWRVMLSREIMRVEGKLENCFSFFHHSRIVCFVCFHVATYIINASRFGSGFSAAPENSRFFSACVFVWLIFFGNDLLCNFGPRFHYSFRIAESHWMRYIRMKILTSRRVINSLSRIPRTCFINCHNFT